MLQQAQSRLTMVFDCCRVLAITRQVPVPCRGFVRQEQGKGEGNTVEANCLSTPKWTVGHRAAIACEGSSGRDWPGRNFFGAALCSAFSLERKARVGWWDVSLLVRPTIQQRALRPRYLCFSHPTTRKLSRLPPSLPLEHHSSPPIRPSLPPPHHTSATMVHTNGNAAHGETFLYVPPRQNHHHHGQSGLYIHM
jgi:hypothetical protein